MSSPFDDALVAGPYPELPADRLGPPFGPIVNSPRPRPPAPPDPQPFPVFEPGAKGPPGDKGEPGETGDKGPPGDKGDSAGAFTFTQAPPAATWVIPHTFGRLPRVSVYDDTGAEMVAEVYATGSSVSVVFAFPTAGSAILA